MSILTLVAIAVALLLGFANGANDNSKGVATLVGSGTMSLKHAIRFAAITTFMGSASATLLAATLLKHFTGKGIVGDELLAMPGFPVAVAAAAAVTVLVATVIAMPISTTHSIVGSLVGIALAAGSLEWAKVWSTFFMPLLVSPFLAMAGAALLYLLFRFIRQRLGISATTCLCVDRKVEPVQLNTDGSYSVIATGLRVNNDDADQCRRQYDGRIVGFEAQRVLTILHIFSAGCVSFARGLNDTPKIAVLMLVGGVAGTAAGEQYLAMLGIGVAMGVGGLIAVNRVAHTMSYRITAMNEGQAYTANLVTAFMVIVASRLGVPVSTTHVSCGSLFGIGTVAREARWKMIGKILLSWITTLPVAGGLGWLIWQLVS